jgi:hypothetical protein
MQWIDAAISYDGLKIVAADRAMNGTDGNIYVYDRSWSSSAETRNKDLYAVACSSDCSRIAAGSYTGIYTSTDSGKSWTDRSKAIGSENIYHLSSSADGVTLAAITNKEAFFLSVDSGATWSKISDGVNRPPIFLADGRITAAVSNERILVSPDNGRSWPLSWIFPEGALGSSIAMPADGSYIVTGGTGALNICR